MNNKLKSRLNYCMLERLMQIGRANIFALELLVSAATDNYGLKVVSLQVHNGAWFIGPLMCDVYVATDVACSTASILLLTVISFDR